MPKIIVTSRYMKSGARSHIGNYVKYIATREGVSLTEKNIPQSQKQEKIIERLTNDFPDSKKLPEYEKYSADNNSRNASECISAIIDDNMDLLADREIYMNYLGTRPNAVRIGSHGLFSETDAPINLAKTAREVAMHEGNVWTHVVSLRREDAERTGYNNLTTWRNLVKRHIDDIAAAQKIDRKNLKWYAAFHDKENNPHVHIVVYSQNPKEGFLTNAGIEKIRSVFANDIYRGELQNLYQKQTAVRNKLRSESDNLMKSLMGELQSGNFSDPALENLILKLYTQLKNSKEKKQYGYLKPEVKKTVDEIVSCLAENAAIKKMYSEWCELEREKYFTYTSAIKEFPPLAKNTVFKPIKNSAINTVLNMNCTLNSPEFEINDKSNKISEKTSSDYYIGKKYLNENNFELAEKYFKISAEKDDPYAMYLLAKLYIESEIPMQKNEAVTLFEKSARLGNSLAAYALGKLYLFGREVEKDTDKARDWLEISASAGNEYAKNLLENMDGYERSAVRNVAVSLLNILGKMVADDYNKNTHSKFITESKLKNAIRRKKLAMGVKDNLTADREVKFYQ